MVSTVALWVFICKTHLIHEFACVEAQAVEEHLFAEHVHFLNSDEQGNCTSPNDGAGPRTNKGISRLVVICIISY